MQKRLKSEFLGDAEFCADKAIAALIGEGDGECGNGEKRRLMLKIMRSVVENELSARQRQTVSLYYFSGMNIPEIAAELGVNRSTVSRTISRGRRNIMEKMKYFL